MLRPFLASVALLAAAGSGGVEPAEASKSGQEARVPYTADYYFYKRK